MSQVQWQYITETEHFIRMLRNHDYIILPEAHRIFYDSTRYNNHRLSLADGLAAAISDYEMVKSMPVVAQNFAGVCLYWINRAFSNGVVAENKEKLLPQLEAKDDEIAQLKRDKAQVLSDMQRISTEYVELQGRYNELVEWKKAYERGGQIEK